MDPENLSTEAVIRVTDWLRGIWEMRRTNAIPVQQWVDSIPSPSKIVTQKSDKVVSTADQNSNNPQTPLVNTDSRVTEPNMTVSVSVPNSPAIVMPGNVCTNTHSSRLARDPSIQSDSSHCSSVESLLELRRADPEAVLLNLGFGGCASSPQESGPLSRIPKRFLKPSKLKGINIAEFMRHQQETTESLDSASLGYRGLTGTPNVAPSEIVQKIMERLQEHDNHDKDGQNNCNSEHNTSENKFSVLSPDNRHFLEQPRSKSPDMRNKRMIIGQKSFVFAQDGELIELENPKITSVPEGNNKTVAEKDSSQGEKDSSLKETDSINNSQSTDSASTQTYNQRIEKRTVLGLSCDNGNNNRRASLRKQRRISDEDAERYLDTLSE